MKSNRLSTTITALLFCFFITACASNNVATDMTEEQKLDEKLKEIHVTNKAKELIVNETNEEALREELVCKREKVIGTKFKKKTCYTRAELAAKRKAAKREADELQRQRSLGSF